jgi:hypothetical protein
LYIGDGVAWVINVENMIVGVIVIEIMVMVVVMFVIVIVVEYLWVFDPRTSLLCRQRFHRRLWHI